MKARTRVKVCCISSADEAALAVAHGANALGFVGPMPSGPGVLDEATIARLVASAPPAVSCFLLTSETAADRIAGQVQRTGVDTVQVVSHIDPAESARLVRLLPSTRRVQVIHVEDEGALSLIDAYAPHVHAFLLDSGRPSLKIPELGGTGRVHNWQVSAQFVRRSPRPVFLAGGLNAGNVPDAIRTVRPYGLDLCSALRTGGQLDAVKLEGFMRQVLEADLAAS